jgi:TRAP-type uncharacterized transport system substrate-binding protein
MEFPTTPMTTRSRVVLEIASELVADRGQPYNQAKVLLRTQGNTDWPLALFGSSTREGIDAVVKGDSALAIINPASILALALKGTSVFKSPLPLRVITVIPSYDNYVFAVRPEFGLTCLEDIAVKRLPLRISLRGHADHSLHLMLDDIAAAAGFSLADIKAWDGDVRLEDKLPPFPRREKFQALKRGDIDAIFDEAANTWVQEAGEAGLTILPLREATVAKLEAMGYRRGVIRKAEYPVLPADVLTIDFSGWPIFVHADTPDDLVTRICAALEVRKHLIPWQGEGPLPLDRMCRETEETPQLVPLHPAAETFWRGRGYLES